MSSSLHSPKKSRCHDAFGNPTSTTGSPQGPFGFAGNWGYQEDPDTGLKLLGHRYYDPSTGRFLTRDPEQDGRNWCGYCAGEPLETLDPDGYEIVWSKGFTAKERARAKKDIKKIRSTRKGRTLYNRLKKSKKVYKIAPIRNENRELKMEHVGACFYDKEDTIYYDPSREDPDKYRVLPCGKLHSNIPNPTDVILEHEMGHAAKGARDPKNVFQNENPYRRERQLPLRYYY